jgi:hypothetical protein
MAQRVSGNFRLGFTASPTFGHIRFDDNTSYSSAGMQTGYAYGIIADFGFAENYFFGSGFLLTTMNGKVDYTDMSVKQRLAYKIQYIEIPLTLKLKTAEGQRIRLYGQFGPDLGVKVSNKHDVTNLPVKERAELIRLGLLAGAGLEWKLGSSDIFTGISYNNPFTRVFKNPGARNNVLMLNLGVFF